LLVGAEINGQIEAAAAEMKVKAMPVASEAAMPASEPPGSSAAAD
jgi:hypothetical protein